jgi:hypothetical protein
MDRFRSRLPQTLSDAQCWDWQGRLDRHGYGRIREGGSTGVSHLAHRIAWEVHHAEPVPPGMCVCHSCDNRSCVNPAHLFIGTPAENNADRAAKQRGPLGSAHHKAKLTPEQVHAIRAAYLTGAETKAQLARRFGISDTSVHLIITRKHWRHLA